MISKNETRIKAILLGEVGVGKTAIIKRFSQDEFRENIESTDSASFIEKKLDINNQKVILELWDTVGQEEYRSLTKLFIKNSKIILLVYDVTSLKTFESLNYWYDYISKETEQKIILGVAGNKLDLIYEDENMEEVPAETAKQFAKKINASFSLISARESAVEIKNLFNELISNYLEIEYIDKELNATIKLNRYSFSTKEGDENKSECCLGNNKKSICLKIAFIGNSGVGKTAIIKALKGKDNITNLPHTKKSYKEKMHYTKNGHEITVIIKDTNGNDYDNDDFERDIIDYDSFFFVFDINKINTLYDMEKYIEKICKRKKGIYLLGYDNSTNKGNEFGFENEMEKFNKKYGCEYENISIEDIYKVKALIIENIGKYLLDKGY